MKKYCDSCEREVETKIITKHEKYEVKGEPVEIDARVRVCTVCGEELWDNDLDGQTILDVYNIYRKRHNLLFPDEIRKIRERYGLTQKSFSRLLGWREHAIQRYENGSVQSKEENELLVRLSDPDEMKAYISKRKDELSDKLYKQISDAIECSKKNETVQSDELYISSHLADKPSSDNGYRSFDYEKFCAMVLYFANQKSELLKTKLMKLLNYSDMIYYKENGISISGTEYLHLPYGPVPRLFDILLGTMEKDDEISVNITYENNYEKHRVIAKEPIPPGVLSQDELAVMERVYQKFLNFGSHAISDYSHRERGYKETPPNKIISYEYARDMSL